MARAECTGLSPWPSFTRYAPSATDVIIGTVSWSALPGGFASRFTLTVDEVLRGSADPVIEFDRFRSGAPQPVCPEGSVLRVRPGDRLAIGYGARYRGQDALVDVVAYVDPSEPDPQLLPRMQQLSEARIREILGLRASSTPASNAPPSGLPGPSEPPNPPVDCRDEFPDVTRGRSVTDAELVELCRDAYLGAGLSPARAYALAEPDYAGMIVHHGSDEGLWFWFTSDLDRHRSDLASLVPEGVAVRVLPARLTWQELGSLQRRITNDLEGLLAAGIPVETVGADPELNAVIVSLRDTTPGAEAVLQGRYGDHVVVEVIGPLSED